MMMKLGSSLARWCLSLFCFWFISVAPVRGGTYFSLSLPKKSRQKKGAEDASLPARLTTREWQPMRCPPRKETTLVRRQTVPRTVLPVTRPSSIRLRAARVADRRNVPWPPSCVSCSVSLRGASHMKNCDDHARRFGGWRLSGISLTLLRLAGLANIPGDLASRFGELYRRAVSP